MIRPSLTYAYRRAVRTAKPRSGLRVWVNATSGTWNPVYTWHCPACETTPLAPAYSPGADGSLPSPAPLKFVRRSAIRSAADHARSCPALRLARLEAELEKLVKEWRRDRDHALQLACAPRSDASRWDGMSLGLARAVLDLSRALTRHLEDRHPDDQLRAAEITGTEE